VSLFGGQWAGGGYDGLHALPGGGTARLRGGTRFDPATVTVSWKERLEEV
jgi:hypothetical protein